MKINMSLATRLLHSLGLMRNDPHDARYARLLKLCESEPEKTFFRQAYKKLSQIGKFTPQVKVGSYRVDFLISDITPLAGRIYAVEVDGFQYHHKNVAQVDYDNRRLSHLMRRNCLVLRYSASLVVRDVEWCVDDVYKTVMAHIWAAQKR